MSLDLDRNLTVTKEDIEFLRKIRYRDNLTMEEYIDLLEELWAVESEPGPRRFYDAVFEL